MEESVKVSIIIRAYNAEKTVAKAIESALAQDFPKELYEVIVVDDGSRDDTARIIDTFQAHPQMRILHQPNQGAIQAANNGFAMAQGAYVVLLDGDDEFLPELLKEMVPVMDGDPSLAFAYCDYIEEFEGEQKHINLADVFQLIAGGTLWRRTLLKAEGWLRNSGIFDEYELILRTWGRWRFAHVSQPLYIYHRSRSSLTGTSEQVRQGIEQLRTLYPERGAEIDRIRSYILPL